MHVAPRDEGRVERGIVAIACLIDLRLRDGHHTSLTIASHRDSCKGLESVLRLLQVGRLKGPVVVTMRSELMPLREDTLDDLGSMLSEVRRTEKSRTYLMLLQYVEEGMRSCDRDTHLLLHRKLDSVLTWHVELLDIEAQ